MAASKQTSLAAVPESVSSDVALAFNSTNATEGIEGVVDAIVTVAQERRAVLLRLKAALLAKDNTTALAVARELVGLGADDEEGD